MVKNRICEFRMAFKMSQTDLSDFLPGKPGKTVLSLIENGHVLPTSDLLEALCLVFGCTPFDLYDASDLVLGANDSKGGGRDENARTVTVRITDELSEAINEVGYSDIGDWLREAKRKLLHDRDIRRMTQRITISPSISQSSVLK